MITDILKLPLVYQMFQHLGGFFDARLKAIGSYLPIKSGQKVVDIGCGPGFIVEHLPRGISYLGFDTDASYIAYAIGKHAPQLAAEFLRQIRDGKDDVFTHSPTASLSGLSAVLDLK